MQNVQQRYWSKWLGSFRACLFTIVFLLASSGSPAMGYDVLFVVGGSKLNKGDQAMKVHLESQGFTVTAQRDADVEAKDTEGKSLVLISESVSPGKVGKTFSDVKVPVICSEASLFDDLGMTAKKENGYTQQESQLTIVDTGHVVVVSPEGTVAVTSKGSKMAWGVPGGNAIKVASFTDAPTKFTFFAYKEGTPMPGGVAPARRVGLFVTADAAEALTADGWKLFDAAVDWAMDLEFFPDCPAWVHTITFVNNCKDAVRITEIPGCYREKIDKPPFNGGKCWPQVAGGGFVLQPGANNKVKIPVLSCWSGNFGVDCSTCSTNIRTLVEFTFDGGLDGDGVKLPNIIDNYDVSLVDGFTKTFHIGADMNTPAGAGTLCNTAGCKKLPACPAKLVDGDACLSPCQWVAKQYDGRAACSHNTDCLSGVCDTALSLCQAPSDDTEYLRYCCKCSRLTNATCTDSPGHVVPASCKDKFGCSPFSHPGEDGNNIDSSCCPFYNNPNEDCNATTQARAWDQWALDYINAIRTDCPGEYSWQYDDKHGTFTCQGTNAPMNYTVTVCP